MRNKFLHMAVAGISLLALSVAFSPMQVQPTAAQDACQTFPQTGKTVCGAFYKYWTTHGGLAQQGYPISGEFKEVSDIDGKTYTVQYFERAEFELHPENPAPFNVLLSLLGTMALHQKYPNGAPASPTAKAPSGQYFPETNQWLGVPFLDYWKAHGGLAQQGYPISDQFPEKSDLDGKLYTVQYFERAVFEWHPENQPPNNVLLSQLGTIRFKAKYPNGEPGTGSGTAVQMGQWGGEHIRLDVSATGVFIDFDCAHAQIGQALTVDGAGNFDVTGVYVQEHGGPVYPGDDQGRPARFTGTASGSQINITITYTDDNSTIGTWTAVLGQQARVLKCL